MKRTGTRPGAPGFASFGAARQGRCNLCHIPSCIWAQKSGVAGDSRVWNSYRRTIGKPLENHRKTMWSSLHIDGGISIDHNSSWMDGGWWSYGWYWSHGSFIDGWWMGFHWIGINIHLWNLGYLNWYGHPFFLVIKSHGFSNHLLDSYLR